MTFHFKIRDLSTDRVLLTPFSGSTHGPLFFTLSYPHPEFYAYMNAGPFATLDDFNAYVDQSDPSRFFYAIIDKTRAPSPACPFGALAGLVAFCGASPGNLSIEIGPMIVLHEFQRTHVASNAIGLLLQYALDPVGKDGLGLRRAQWECASENRPSMRVAEKMGFAKEGLLSWHVVHWDGVARGKVGNRKGLPEGGVEGDLGRDTVVYSLCWDDWEGGGREKIQAIMDRRDKGA